MACSKEICVTVTCLIGCIFFLGLFLFWFDIPTHPNIYVTDASLTLPNFSTTHQHQQHYNLALNITIRNPNWFYKTYNDNTRLVAYCKNSSDKVLGTVSLNPFGQGTKKTKAFTALSFKGEKNDDNLKACRATSDGDYDDMVIKLYLSNIYYLGGKNVKDASYQLKTEFICDLKVPLITAGMTSTPKAFRNTKCKSTFQLYY